MSGDWMRIEDRTEPLDADTLYLIRNHMRHFPPDLALLSADVARQLGEIAGAMTDSAMRVAKIIDRGSVILLIEPHAGGSPYLLGLSDRPETARPAGPRLGAH